jgi:AbiV family abortive infection protein
MDLAAVKQAPPRELARGSVAAARNACGLVADAELLSGAGRLARAYSLAGIAIEEVGKAGSLATLAGMPEKLRARAPVRRMLEWHQGKLVAGQFIAAYSFSPPGVAVRFATEPLSEIAATLDGAQAFAEDMDRLKQRGLYVDVDGTAHVREPSEVTAAEVRDQLDRAQRAARAVYPLLEPCAPPWLFDPPLAGVEFSRALVSAYNETKPGRSPEAAADVLRNTASKLH